MSNPKSIVTVAYPEHLGDAATQDDMDRINGTLFKAAELADVTVCEGRSAESSALRDYIANETNELDWFAAYCAGGNRWNRTAWAKWMREQA